MLGGTCRHSFERAEMHVTKLGKHELGIVEWQKDVVACGRSVGS